MRDIETIFGGTDSEVEIGDDGVLDVDNGISIGDATYSLDSSATVGPNETVTVDVEQFRNGGYDSQVDMTGETVTMVLSVHGLDSDDSGSVVSAEIELTAE